MATVDTLQPPRSGGLDPLLLRILAATDALWLPVRTWPEAMTHWQLRQRFLSHGWALDAASEGANRAEQSRRLRALAGAGHLSIRYQQRTPLVRLSDATEDRLRATIGHAGSILGGWLTCERVAEVGGEWVPEWKLAGWDAARPARSGDDVTRELVLVEDLALPALIRGWLESNASARRRVAYRLTDAGRRQLSQPAPTDTTARRLFDPEAAAAYAGLLAEHRERLVAMVRPDEREIAPIPLAEQDA